MYKLSATENELIAVLKHRVDKHTCLGIMFVLKEENNFQKMLQYLEWNPYASQTDIMQEHRRILGLPAYQLKPRPVWV